MGAGEGTAAGKRAGTSSSVGRPLGAALLFGVMVMLLAAVLISRRRFRPRVAVAGSSGGRAGGPPDGGGDEGMVAAAAAMAPEIHAAVAGFVAGNCRGEEEADEEAVRAEGEAQDDAPRPGALETDAGETGLIDPGRAVAASPSMALTASGFVVVPGKAKAEVLGVPRLSYGGAELSFGRAEASDLFALLATSREGVSTEGIIDTLWPGDGERGGRLLESAVRQLNQVMRQASGLAVGVRFVVTARQRRHLAAAYFDVDYWRFEDAFVRAGTAEEEPARLAALQEMLTLYRGPLLAERDGSWVLPRRQAAQTRAVDAAARLAESRRRADPERALDVLMLAVERIDPHSEVLWCGIMSLHGELGRLPAVRRSFELLRERLAEIDAVPSPQARQVYERFVR
ncbi:AfsR/SARP family transcriptional regulator [Nonomuraea insulae]|uniref:BTAD domain-containing putative transcriptional regulator n=1 Tax=Nonomuraea insulae TaxID=1616787 RepID=A0ABW1CQT4_9ACTN